MEKQGKVVGVSYESKNEPIPKKIWAKAFSKKDWGW